MDEKTWIYVPESGIADGAERADWTGRIWSEGEQTIRWKFEVIRLTEPRTMYDQGVFQEALPVSVLIDHQRPATLFRPITLRVDPGKGGEKYPYLRTRLTGSFHALLKGIAVENESQPLFVGMGAESDTFSAWYGGRAFNDNVDERYRTTSIDLLKPEEEIISVKGLGEVKVVRAASVQRGHAESMVRSKTILRITFDQPKTLSDALEFCSGIELLFGFLTGFRPKFPVFHLWWSDDEGDKRTLRDSELELGGVSSQHEKLSHHVDCLHMKGRDAAGLKEVLEAYAVNPPEYLSRIAAVQAGRWFAETLNDKFASVMPVFEELLQAGFKSGDEEDYSNSEKSFFDYVEESNDEDLINFSRKHLKVVDRKSPGLPTLIERAMNVLNDAGFEFSMELAKRINKRRATMFHSSLVMGDKDVTAFYEETSAVTAMLMLLTLRDLGVDLKMLPSHHSFTSNFRQFAKKPSAPEEGA